MICLDVNIFLFLALFSYRDDLDENIGTPVPKNAKSPLPFDMRLSKPLLLK